MPDPTPQQVVARLQSVVDDALWVGLITALISSGRITRLLEKAGRG